MGAITAVGKPELEIIPDYLLHGDQEGLVALTRISHQMDGKPSQVPHLHAVAPAHIDRL